jgi:hypothetical protein
MHVYHKGVAKKDANNVALFILKTLQQLNLLHDDSAGVELNIICLGKNKNNTVLKMAVCIQQMGCFQMVNFVFLLLVIQKMPLTDFLTLSKLSLPSKIFL